MSNHPVIQEMGLNSEQGVSLDATQMSEEASRMVGIRQRFINKYGEAGESMLAIT
uniref:Uncharacterized protein n=1 Tax=Kwoniella pini CBS 10737 TaxID=1296096 RepID=A0A1B9I6U0_9TREE|nr:uncharacterized protein I206_03322 [Kwoniella pini CBS 10737]OCF51255.1 hypothetical protein I206_03322 [Kwoniella pini CBS 10737]